MPVPFHCITICNLLLILAVVETIYCSLLLILAVVETRAHACGKDAPLHACATAPDTPQ